MPSEGSLAALCLAQAHMEVVKEYVMMRKLVMEHFWSFHGDKE